MTLEFVKFDHLIYFQLLICFRFSSSNIFWSINLSNVIEATYYRQSPYAVDLANPRSSIDILLRIIMEINWFFFLCLNFLSFVWDKTSNSSVGIHDNVNAWLCHICPCPFASGSWLMSNLSWSLTIYNQFHITVNDPRRMFHALSHMFATYLCFYILIAMGLK